MTSSAFGEWLGSSEAEPIIDQIIQAEIESNMDDVISAVRESFDDDGDMKTSSNPLNKVARRVVNDLRERFNAMHPNAEDERYDRIHAHR